MLSDFEVWWSRTRSSDKRFTVMSAWTRVIGGRVAPGRVYDRQLTACSASQTLLTQTRDAGAEPRVASVLDVSVTNSYFAKTVSL